MYVEDGCVMMKVYKRFLWAQQQEKFAGKAVLLKDITRALISQYEKYESAVYSRVHPPPKPIADIPDDVESLGDNIILGPGGGKETEPKDNDGSVASSTTVVEKGFGVKRSFPGDGVDGAELQRRVRFRGWTA